MKSAHLSTHFHDSIRIPARTINQIPNSPDPVNPALRVRGRIWVRLPVKTPHHPPNAFSGAFAAPDFFCTQFALLAQQGACAARRSSDKSRSSLERRYSSVAQLVEQVTVNHRVGGSSPSRGAILKRHPDTGVGQPAARRAFSWPPASSAPYSSRASSARAASKKRARRAPA